MTAGTHTLEQSGCRLWIDGVGSWLLWLGDEFTIGNASLSGGPRGYPGTDRQVGPPEGSTLPHKLPQGTFPLSMHDRCGIGSEEVPRSAEEGAKHLGVQADLRTRHATFTREREEYRIVPHGAVRLNDAPIDGETLLRNNDRLTLGSDVSWRFLVPSPLSRSAVLRFESSHRPVPRVDGVVLLDQTCLLGPERQTHIPCPAWPESVILFLREGAFWAKTDGTISNSDGKTSAPVPVNNGSILSGEEWRFRVEMM